MLRKCRDVFFLLLVVFTSPVQGDEIKTRVEQPVQEAISIMQKTQENEEEWRSLQEKLGAEYDLLQLQVEQLTGFKNELEQEVARAKDRVEKKKQQLRDIKQIEKEMEPFLKNLLVRLEALPGEQLPFLQQERRRRIARLALTIDAPEISLSEKFRKSMEVLQIEAEFGMTIESTQEMVDIGGREILANIFRLGRVGLYYVTLDENQCGFFDPAKQSWQELPGQYIEPLKTAVAVAEKRRPVEFINMPLGRLVKR